eukprot:scaffold245335_cov32-Prasinocladus_malaysianus.AAC.1
MPDELWEDLDSGDEDDILSCATAAIIDGDLLSAGNDSGFDDQDSDDCLPARVHGNKGASITNRKRNKIRDRSAAMKALRDLSAKEYRVRFKVQKERFWWLVDKIRPMVEVPEGLGYQMAIVSSKSIVPAALRLATTLRWLAGSRFIDAADLHGIGATTAYASIWEVVDALIEVLKEPLDLHNDTTLASLSDDMYARSGRTVMGCIGAVDGMAVRIGKPNIEDPVTEEERNVRHFMNRKGFYSINLQAVADANRKIIYHSLETQGSTHDSLAWKMSTLGKLLEEYPLPEGYWIAGDEAYVCNEYLITPYSVGQTRADKYKDNFNFYLSRCRINVECAFGILVARFGVLRRQLTTSLKHTSKVVHACILLHNVAIDDGVKLCKPLAQDSTFADSLAPLRQDKLTIAERGLKKRSYTTMRDQLMNEIKQAGRVRPAHRRQRRRT